MISSRRSALAATSGRMVFLRKKRTTDDTNSSDDDEDEVDGSDADGSPEDGDKHRPKRGVCCMCSRILSTSVLRTVAVWTWRKKIRISDVIDATRFDISCFGGTAPPADVTFRQGDKLCHRCATLCPAFLEENNTRCWGHGPVGKACDGQVIRKSNGQIQLYQGRSYCADCYRAAGKCALCPSIIGPQSKRHISKDKSLCWQYICCTCYGKERGSFTCANCGNEQGPRATRLKSKLAELQDRWICRPCADQERGSFTCANCGNEQGPRARRRKSKLAELQDRWICRPCAEEERGSFTCANCGNEKGPRATRRKSKLAALQDRWICQRCAEEERR